MREESTKRLALTRRTALQYGAALPVSFAFGLLATGGSLIGPARAQAVVVRREIHNCSDADLEKLRAAVKELKDRSAADPQDPKGWDMLAVEHALHCIGSFPVDPGEVHFGWWFLPWHRAFLRAMELRVQAVLGDDTLGLPYWNWQRFFELPEAYAGDPIVNPLVHANRNPQVVDPVRLRMRDVLTSADFTAFGGAAFPPFPEPFQPGILEQFPHGHVHVRVGGDMGAFETAALDPVFWAHHANVDRIWEVWLRGNGHSNPTAQDWLDHTFQFPDPDGASMSFRVGDMLDPEAMGFRYDEVDFDMDLSNASGPIAFGPEPFSTTALAVPDDNAAAGEAVATETTTDGKIVIAVDGLLIPGQPTQVDVYVTPTDSTNSTAGQPIYAGTIPLVPGKRNQTGPKIYVEIPVPPQIANADRLVVTLDQPSAMTEAAAAAEDPIISVDDIRILRK